MPEKHILLICPEPIRSCIQGIGIRFLEMARILQKEHHVRIWTCNEDIPDDIDLPLSPFPSGEAFQTEILQTDAVLVHGHIAEKYFENIAFWAIASPPLIVDLYDPFLIENLQYTDELGEEIFYRDRDILFRQLERGDFFLASSEIQRMFYLGIMAGMGRFSPAVYHRDKELYTLMSVAPFGIEPVSRSTLRKLNGKLKNCVPGITSDDIVLFFGGVYDWYDPETLMDALSTVVDHFPMLRIIFCANPNQETTPQGVYKNVKDFSNAKGWTNRNVFFISWFPYKDRFTYLRDVDIALCLHKPSLETSLSLRTRILDYMNAGIPIIATEGGEGGRILKEADAAVLVPPYDVEAIREALLKLLGDELFRENMGERGRQWVQGHMTWPQSLQPLIDFCNSPRKSACIETRNLSNTDEGAFRKRRIASILRRVVHYFKAIGWMHKYGKS